jgi:hypothetical protein
VIVKDTGTGPVPLRLEGIEHQDPIAARNATVIEEVESDIAQGLRHPPRAPCHHPTTALAREE